MKKSGDNIASGFLWLQIGLFKKRGVKKVINIDSKSLTQFVDDTQFYRIIGAVNDIADRGFWNATSFVKQIWGHISLRKKLRKPLADRFIKLHIITTRSCNCTISIGVCGGKIVPVAVPIENFVL